MPPPPSQPLYVQTSNKAKDKMPLCKYDTACTRKDCIYRHSPKPSSNNAATTSSSSSTTTAAATAPVCVPFLAGKCAFGTMCRNRHPVGDEKAGLLARMANTPCRHGVGCFSEHCLYLHPAGRMSDSMAKLQIGGTAYVPELGGLVDVTSISAGGAHVVQGAAITTSGNETNKPAQRLLSAPLEFPKSEALLKRQAAQPAIPSPSPPVASIKMPEDTFVPSWNRDHEAYEAYVNPMDKLRAVNVKSPKGVIDLHFQTAEEVVRVLYTVLRQPPSANPHTARELEWEFYDENEHSVWIVTGVGSHTITKGRKLIFDVVLSWLQEEKLFTYKVSKEGAGFCLYL